MSFSFSCFPHLTLGIKLNSWFLYWNKWNASLLYILKIQTTLPRKINPGKPLYIQQRSFKVFLYLRKVSGSTLTEEKLTKNHKLNIKVKLVKQSKAYIIDASPLRLCHVEENHAYHMHYSWILHVKQSINTIAYHMHYKWITFTLQLSRVNTIKACRNVLHRCFALKLRMLAASL